MSDGLPWDPESLRAASWAGVQRALARCAALLEQERLSTTLMLLGAPGLGREAVAVELAAALICRSGQPGCGCSSCERVRRGVHPDLEVLDVETGRNEIRVAQVEAATGGMARHPYEGARRVFVVADCQTPPLNAHSASALLKTLEEPEEHVVVLLLAANHHRVLPTILSRSVVLRVPRPTGEELLASLARRLQVPDGQAGELLTLAGGDAALLSSQGDAGTFAATAGRLHELARAALLEGDGLALVRLASLVRTTPAGASLLAGALVRLAGDGDAGLREALLAAAAAVLSAERRRAALNLDVEAAVTGALAPFVLAASRP